MASGPYMPGPDPVQYIEPKQYEATCWCCGRDPASHAVNCRYYLEIKQVMSDAIYEELLLVSGKQGAD